ncbi:hypothetical protein LTR49_027520 [Elasticomyces elasticus]|nr:hypothetical protein LTR49_027520 [Elasticomyces elasticus]
MTVAFIVDELRGRSSLQLPQPKICYYYCRDDETGNTTQILSALILVIFEHLPGLKKSFFDWYKANQASSHIDPGTNASKLAESLQDTIEELKRTIYIVIDGLDECDRQSQNTALKFIKSSQQKSTILPSSRGGLGAARGKRSN